MHRAYACSICRDLSVAYSPSPCVQHREGLEVGKLSTHTSCPAHWAARRY